MDPIPDFSRLPLAVASMIFDYLPETGRCLPEGNDYLAEAQRHALNRRTELTLAMSSDKSYQLLSLCPHLTKFTINSYTNVDFDRLGEALCQLHYLEILDLQGSVYRLEEPVSKLVAYLHRIPSLTSFNSEFRSPFVQNIGDLASSFQDLTNLKEVGLSGIHTDYLVKLLPVIGTFTDLTSLNLYGSRLYSQQPDFLPHILESLPHLEHLDLTMTFFGTTPFQYLVGPISKLVHLKSLSLEYNCLNKIGMGFVLEILKSLPNLIELNLNSNMLGVDGLQLLIDSFDYLPHLTTLKIAGNSFGRCPEMVNRALLPQFKHLEIGRNNLDLSFLTSLPSLSNLESLDIFGSHLTSETLRGILNLPNLVYLNLSQIKIPNDPQVLTKDLRLTTLLLSRARISSSMLVAFLAHLPYLVKLDLTRIHLNRHRITILTEILPSLLDFEELTIDENYLSILDFGILMRGLISLINFRTISFRQTLERKYFKRVLPYFWRIFPNVVFQT